MSPTSSIPLNISIDAIFAKSSLLKPFFELLPKALHALLKKDGESLERLQLTEIVLAQKTAIASNDDTADLGPVTIRRMTDGDLFLKLDFSIFQQGMEMLACEITYFVRGQKKFFKPELPSYEEKSVHSENFDLDSIRSFFADLHQENPMFLNTELVGLARTTLVVPSQIIAAYLLRAISFHTCEKVRLVFFSEIKPGEPFNVHYLEDGKGQIIFCHGRPIACLYQE